MITPKIKSLFQFIDFLNSNIDEFNRYNYLIDELDNLYNKRNKLEPEKNYYDKKEHEDLQSRIDEKSEILLKNTIYRVNQKATELGIYNSKRHASIYNDNKDEAFNIINLVEDSDIPKILNRKSKYIEFRTKTRFAVLQQKDLYDKLDLILKVVFNFFDRKVKEEFNKLPRYEQIVISNLTKHKRQMNKDGINKALADFFFFQIEVIADLEFEGKTYKNLKQKNNDSILTPENWEQHKETFFAQRMATYKESYTLSEKIKLELSVLEKLSINKTDYQILKDRYNEYLKTLPPQPITKQKPELNEALISFRSPEIIENLHKELNGYFQDKEAELLKALKGEQLNELLLFPHNQNKLVEVFVRLKYNGFILSNKTEIKDWICSNFAFRYKRGETKEVRKFNNNTVADILKKPEKEPAKKERICIVDWLPYKSYYLRN